MTSHEPIYTLADLDTWSFDGTALAVLGHPIKHSVSPPMHNAALAQMAMNDPKFKDWKYFRFDIEPSQLPLALEKFLKCGFKGLNLTVPHKVLAFDLVDTTLSNAGEIGAVNTLSYDKNFKTWAGYNTDGHGLEMGILENLKISLKDKDIILIGAGGAARGAAVTCLQKKCRSLCIGNRTPQTLDALIMRFERGFLWGDVKLRGFNLMSPPKDLPIGALVINATSAGLKAGDPPPIDLAALPRPAGVYDMIYNPPETPLLAQAHRLGIPAANGLSMLVHQGVRSLEIWSGAAVPVDAMRTAVVKAMSTH